MTHPRLGGCICHVSRILVVSRQHAAFRSVYAANHRYADQLVHGTPAGQRQPRRYSTAPRAKGEVVSAAETVKVDESSLPPSSGHDDDVNPPTSTLPPPLDLPTRGDESRFRHLLRVGKACINFYKTGSKAVYSNWKESVALSQRLRANNDGGWVPLRFTQVGGFFLWARRARLLVAAGQRGQISRRDYQLLARSSYDVKKVPLFALLLLIFGEWLPLIVIYIPGAVPSTCRIPKQTKKLREQAQERRRETFRSGIAQPEWEKMGMGGGGTTTAAQTPWPLLDPSYTQRLAHQFSTAQLGHVTATLGLNGRIWHWLPIGGPPRLLMESRLAKRMHYLALDDLLLSRHKGWRKLSQAEVEIACEERGMDVLGRPTHDLRDSLELWLKAQQSDKGAGRSMSTMLFRR